jgi:hypothetical protein
MSELIKPQCKINLPYNVVLHILQYDRRYVIKNGKIIIINKIPLEDYRYNLLNTSFINNPLVIKLKSHIVDNVYYVNVRLKLIINCDKGEKEYEFTLRHFYFDNDVMQVRRHLFLRKNGINIESHLNY